MLNRVFYFLFTWGFLIMSTGTRLSQFNYYFQILKNINYTIIIFELDYIM